MDPLGFMTGGPNGTDDSAISPVANVAYATQAAAFGMSLQDGLDLLGGNLASVKQRIEGIGEGLLIVDATEALTTFVRLAVFVVGFGAIAEGAAHVRRDISAL